MSIFQPFKVVAYSLIQLIKGNTKGVAFKVSIIIVKYQAAQYSRVGLAKLLFKNISLLIKVYKNSQFKIKVIIFTTILRFVGIELSQISQLLTVGLYLGGLQIYSLQIYSLRIYSLRIYSLNNRRGLVYVLSCKGVTVHNLGYRGITVRNLSTRYTLVRKINSKTTQVYRTNLVKRVRYKASNYIKFKKNKEFLSSVKLVQDFFFSPFYLVFFMYYIIQKLYYSNLFIPFNLYALVI